MKKQIGKLIICEGGEFVGKSLQIDHLFWYFSGRGYDVLRIKEPPAEDIDGFNARAELMKISPDDPERVKKELAVLMKGRSLVYSKIIIPARQAGKIILCDRGPDSSVIYQGYAMALDPDASNLKEPQRNERKELLELQLNYIRRMNNEATQGLKADLTILLDMNPEDALTRARNDKEKTRFDRAPLEFHNKIKMGYLWEELRDSEKKIKSWIVVWANDDPYVITQKIIKAISEKLGL